MFTFDVDAAIGNGGNPLANSANFANPTAKKPTISKISKISNPILPFSTGQTAGAGTDRQQPANVATARATIAPEIRTAPGAGTHTAAELRALVNAVTAFHGFTPEQTAEAQEIAQADPVAALECFREQAARIPLSKATDDRIHCTDCARLRGRICAQAAMLGASQGYTPVQRIARRCEGFKPLAGAADQRTGAQRWPGLLIARPGRTVH